VEHRALFVRINDFNPWPFPSAVRQGVSLGGNQYELILLKSQCEAVPGESHVLAVLMRMDRIVDHVALTMPTEVYHLSGANLEESQQDGTLHLVVRGIRMFSEPFVLSYAISDKGFGHEVRQSVQPTIAVGK
jgi:hypothetical protein